MKKIFNLDAPIIRWVSKISWLLWMNCLWFVCCLPVVTVGASTAAFYRMVFDLRHEGNYSAKAFFKAFRENFRQATLVWLVILAAGVLVVLAYNGIFYIGDEMVRLALALAVCAVAAVALFVAVYSFPLVCWFDNTAPNHLVNALAMSIKHLRQTVLCCALAMLPVVALILSPYWFLYLLYVWLLFYPGLAAYWISGILQPVLEQY